MQRPAIDEAALTARAVANFVETFRTLARFARHGAIEEADGLTLIATGVPTPAFNPAFVTHQLADPAALVARLRRFYARAGMPGELIAVGAEEARDARMLAETAGLVPDGTSRGMLLFPLPDEPPLPAGLAIRIVRDATMLRRYNDTLAEGFGTPREVLAIFEDPAILDLPDLTFYLGFLDDEPVATALRFTSQRIAGVYNVATRPAYRRRGFGAALTWRAALDGRGEGCLASALQSSRMAFPLYRQMGYRHVIDFQTWTIAAT
jgi:GNAT superfamily N-acetyltransferase